jgi:hypothetical protein
MYQDARDEKQGFFAGLKEKAASKFTRHDSKSNMTGAPPGLTNAPEGWSFATNRGPTSGQYAPTVGGYNPQEKYYGGASGGAVGGGYTSGQEDPRASASSQLREKAYEGERRKGKVGGAWGDSPAGPPPAATAYDGGRTQSYGGPPSFGRSASSEYSYNESQHGGVSGPSPSAAGGAAVPTAIGRTTGAASDGTYERNLVHTLCAPGGMRPIPPKDKMDAFLKSALTLDANIVGPILQDCLEDDAWTVVSKALAIIDALLKTSGCDNFFDYFADNSTEIEQCSKSDKAAVRDRAVKILNTLGHSAHHGTSAPPVPSSVVKTRRSRPSSHQPAQADLLGGFDDEPVQAQGAPAQTGDLFSGLQTIQQGQGHPPAAAPDAVSQTADMFGGLQLQGSLPNGGAPSPQGQPQQQAPVASQPQKPQQIFDPLLQMDHTTSVVSSNPNAMNMNLMGMMGANPQPQQQQQQQQQQQNSSSQMAQMQYMQQLQYMQQQIPPSVIGPDGRSRLGSNSQVIGAAMTPTGYIAKTIQEPSEETSSSETGFGFMKKKEDDSFNFVKDAMKNI